MTDRQKGFTAKIVETFVDSRLSLLLLIITLLAGAAALFLTPREEEPQIVVPLVDIVIDYPGASPTEVERSAVLELETLVRGLPGVEHVYSQASEGQALISLRFTVGHDRERALVDTFTRINANLDRVPAGLAGWLVRPVDIDDVPMLTMALHDDRGEGERLNGAALRAIAEELADRLGAIDDVSLATIVGGEPRVIEVVLDRDRLAALSITPLEVGRALRAANVEDDIGVLREDGRSVSLRAGAFLRSAHDLASAVIAVREGRPIALEEVAEVRDGTLEPSTYTRIGFGPGAVLAGFRDESGDHGERASVSLSLAKRKGSNAVGVAEAILEGVEAARGTVIPDGVTVTVTRNDGATADAKVNELVEHILVAVITVILVLLLGLGWREALVVAIAIPVTFSVALFLDLAAGYTINRVTLFALVLSLGLLVDDPIVDVENIHRHFRMGKGSARDAVIRAVNEVRPPLILATLTVIVSFLPMYFITGMMGPYMAPMPFNITVVMLTSLVVALTITPWASYRLLKKPDENAAPEKEPQATLIGRVYGGVMRPMMQRRGLGFAFLGVVFLAFLGSVALPLTGAVPLKMLPFANKDRLQLVVELDEGTTLETTDAAVRDFAEHLLAEPDVAFVESFAGIASPHDFQGLVRHEFLRRGDHVGDLRIGLISKDAREQSSHQIALRLRRGVEEVAQRHGARIRITESPPGPPVLQTLVAEVRGSNDVRWSDQVAAAADLRARFEAIEGIEDVDWQVNEAVERPVFTVDKPLAARHGVTTAEVVETLALVAGEEPVTSIQDPTARRPVPVVARLPREERADPGALAATPLRFGEEGAPLTVGDVTAWVEETGPLAITRKDLERVVFLTADVVGISPADAVFAVQGSLRDDPLPEGIDVNFRGEGEWKITLDVFRDLGIAFAAALLGIYVILVGQTRSLVMPLVMMAAIPITAIGIFPGFWLINVVRDGQVGEFADPTWFTATAMIGMIALAGIVVRNSVILIDFIEVQLGEGQPLFQAVLEAGAVRLRPILLTAATSLLGVWVMTLDPIFSGLAWSFIFGILASTAFTLFVIPLIYFLLRQRREGRTA